MKGLLCQELRLVVAKERAEEKGGKILTLQNMKSPNQVLTRLLSEVWPLMPPGWAPCQPVPSSVALPWDQLAGATGRFPLFWCHPDSVRPSPAHFRIPPYSSRRRSTSTLQAGALGTARALASHSRQELSQARPLEGCLAEKSRFTWH